MPIHKSRTKDKIFADMHRELRKWNPEVPQSVDRLDPILKILLELYASQLERIDKRVDETWQVAVNSLIRALAPECQRWPVPAYTIMKCEAGDPVVEIDPLTRFFYKEKREGGKTFFFSSQKKEKLISAKVRVVLAQFEDVVLDLSPGSGGGTQTGVSGTELKSKGPGQVFLGVEYDGMPTGFKGATLCLRGEETVLRQLRWGYWYPGSKAGEFYDDANFCPGLTTTLEDLFTEGDEPADWGGLRSSADLFKPLENNFVIMPEIFTSTWEAGPVDTRLQNLIGDSEVRSAATGGRLYWIRIDLPPGGDKTRFKAGFEAHFNCFVATNKNGLSTYKYTGGNSLVEVEIPEPLDTILEITQVIDSSRNEYLPRYRVRESVSDKTYSVEERGNKLVLWFDYSSELDSPPDHITVHYNTTAGVSANGIEAGQISGLYEKHPGVSEAVNITPVRGAIPAKTQKQVVTEVSARLRNRDRALSFNEVAAWAKTFDPRIKEAVCENSVERAARGVRRCILVKVKVGAEDFYSEDEAELVKQRLRQFLKSRAPVNSRFQVEIVRR